MTFSSSSSSSSSSASAATLAASRINICLNFEKQLLASNSKKKALPVTIVSGFLGAGKTSLLQHVLAHRHNLRIACAVSDMASLNLDEILVAEPKREEKHTQLGRQHVTCESTAHSSAHHGHHRDKSNAIGTSSEAAPPAVFGLKDRSVDALKEVVWRVLQEQDAQLQLDYLIVETSGTTDPTELVSSVQERFGKMTRARLDSVVIVADSDALVHDASQGVEPCEVAQSQLSCADVVLLNKVDLLATEDAKQVARQVIAKYAPFARVYETCHGEIALPNILDVSPPQLQPRSESNGGGANAMVSHESVQMYWNVGNMTDWNAISKLRRKTNDASGILQQDVKKTNCRGMHEFDSVMFVHETAPISLSALENFLFGGDNSELASKPSFRDQILRIKGVVHVQEAAQYRFVVQMSGRHRVDVQNTGEWTSTPKTELVVIGGRNLNGHELLKYMERVLVLSPQQTSDAQVSHKKQQCLDLLQQEPRLKLVHDTNCSLEFCMEVNFSTFKEQVKRHAHHIDENELTLRLVREVNAMIRMHHESDQQKASQAKGLLLYRVVQDAERSRVVAIAGVDHFASVWPNVQQRMELLETEIRKILSTCLCNF